MRKMLEDHGYEDGLKVVTRLVQEADIALGGDGDPSRCVPTAANAMIGNGHRGLGFLVVAIREGYTHDSMGLAIDPNAIYNYVGIRYTEITRLVRAGTMSKKSVPLVRVKRT